jgi:hypothetical protein
MVKLAENLMLMASLESGTLKIEIDRNRARRDLRPLIDEVVSDLSIEARRRNAAVQVQVRPGLAALCSPSHLQDAFRRMLTNSIQFSKDGGGQITITAEQRDQRVEITLADNGIGIDPLELLHLFKPIEEIVTDGMMAGAHGIGLSIARSLIMLQEGDIRIESQLGRGTTTTISLPAD